MYKSQGRVGKKISRVEKCKLALTCAGDILLKPNLSVHMDPASSAAGSTNFVTFRNASNFSMQENNSWK